MAEPQPYDFLEGEAIVPVGISEAHSIMQSMHWIGFRQDDNRNALISDAFESFNDVKLLTEKDITTLSSSFAARTQQNGRMHIGTRRTKWLKAFVHWNQDFYRISQLPSIVSLNETTFKEQLSRALTRADIRQSLKSQTSTAASAASPGPLKSEREWKQWEEKFLNYAGTHVGANGIPLSYVIRDNDDPDTATEHSDFIKQTIACAPLSGEYYNADRLSVFNMITSFTTGQPSGDWVKDTNRYADGRRSMNALRSHFAGEGNASRNLGVAERLHESLHYRNERAMTFESFLTNCQKMFNIYKHEDEPLTEEAKVRYLFKRVQHPGLQNAIEALKTQQTLGTVITYTTAANHLSTAVSELPDYIAKNRNISQLGVRFADDVAGQPDNTTIYKEDGKINTGFIPNWRSLSTADRELVHEERKRLGISSKGKGGRNKKAYSNDSNRMKQLQRQNKKYKRQIKSMKRKPSTNDDDDANKDDSNDDIDAGDEFGGRNSKKNKKSSSNN